MQQPVVEQSCFAGWYFGIHGGGVIADLDQDASVVESSLGATGNGPRIARDLSRNDDDGDSAEGGLHAGYNWLFGKFLFGLEGDIQATSIDQNTSARAAVFLPNNDLIPFSTEIKSKSSLDWFATLRPRFGFLFGNRVLLFVTGGGALGDPGLSESTRLHAFRNEYPSVDKASSFNETRDQRWGWTGGGGVEFCITPHVSFNVTYLFTNLENTNLGSEISFTGTGAPRFFHAHSNTSSDNDFHTVSGGVSFHF
ncbi:MAG: outer rane immunogenic protein [Verrucomicrobiota bacterium]